MASNLSVLTLPWNTPNRADFDICDRRYGLNLDIPQCDVAAGRLAIGSGSIEYQVSNREGPHTLPKSISYGNCMVSVELSGPHLPSTYAVVPNTISSVASHLINECVGRAGRTGGFATLDLDRLIDFVISPGSDLESYPPETSFLTVSVSTKSAKKPSPGNFDPIIAETLADTLRDAAMAIPASATARRELVQRASLFRQRSMRMSTGGSTFPWWGKALSRLKMRMQELYS